MIMYAKVSFSIAMKTTIHFVRTIMYAEFGFIVYNQILVFCVLRNFPNSRLT